MRKQERSGPPNEDDLNTTNVFNNQASSPPHGQVETTEHTVPNISIENPPPPARENEEALAACEDHFKGNEQTKHRVFENDGQWLDRDPPHGHFEHPPGWTSPPCALDGIGMTPHHHGGRGAHELQAKVPHYRANGVIHPDRGGGPSGVKFLFDYSHMQLLGTPWENEEALAACEDHFKGNEQTKHRVLENDGRKLDCDPPCGDSEYQPPVRDPVPFFYPIQYVGRKPACNDVFVACGTLEELLLFCQEYREANPTYQLVLLDQGGGPSGAVLLFNSLRIMPLDHPRVNEESISIAARCVESGANVLAMYVDCPEDKPSVTLSKVLTRTKSNWPYSFDTIFLMVRWRGFDTPFQEFPSCWTIHTFNFGDGFSYGVAEFQIRDPGRSCPASYFSEPSRLPPAEQSEDLISTYSKLSLLTYQSFDAITSRDPSAIDDRAYSSSSSLSSSDDDDDSSDETSSDHSSNHFGDVSSDESTISDSDDDDDEIPTFRYVIQPVHHYSVPPLTFPQTPQPQPRQFDPTSLILIPNFEGETDGIIRGFNSFRRTFQEIFDGPETRGDIIGWDEHYWDLQGSRLVTDSFSTCTMLNVRYEFDLKVVLIHDPTRDHDETMIEVRESLRREADPDVDPVPFLVAACWYNDSTVLHRHFPDDTFPGIEVRINSDIYGRYFGMAFFPDGVPFSLCAHFSTPVDLLFSVFGS